MRLIRRLLRDEKGNFFVFFGVSVAVLFGMVALSFDLGRLAAVQTELQSFADSVALAAAAELDGREDSIDRAATAAALVTDTQVFATGGNDLTTADYTLTFLSALPAGDVDADPVADVVCSGAGCGDEGVDQGHAIFVRVDVNPHTLPMNFASVVSVLTGGEEMTGAPAATATAGFTQYACDIAPLMFCMPDENDDGIVEEIQAGQMVRLRAGGNSAAWGPGNFGFLDVSNAFVDGAGPCGGESGTANITRCLLGAINAITQCYSVRGVDTETGQRVGITTEPFNFRFDIFDQNAGEVDDGDFAPGPNVIWGQQPTISTQTRRGVTTVTSIDQCTPIADGDFDDDEETSIALPRGADFAADTEEVIRFGDTDSFDLGTAERQEYMRVNWGYTTGDPFPNARTRWEVYLEEIDAIRNGRILQPMVDAGGNPIVLRDGAGNPILDANGNQVNVRQETGLPQCSPNRSADPFRRVVVAAAVDCETNEVQGATSNLPVETFYHIFMTEPVRETGGGDLDIFGEVIGEAGGTGSGSTSNGIFRDVVQLYR